LLRLACAVSSATTVAACSSADSGPASPTAPPAVQVSFSITAGKIPVGGSTTLSWTSTNASACTIDQGIGAQPTQGTVVVTPTSGGRFTYTLTCTGAGARATAPVTLVVPMPVWPSSYENAKRIVLPDRNVPHPAQYGLQDGFFGTAMAFGDFFQEGAYSAILALTPFGTNGQPPSLPSRLYTLQRGTGWIEATGAMFNDRTGCVHPRKSLVADFNRDGRPDVFFVCHGYDAPPFVGEPQRILLSQPDGTYRNSIVASAITGYTHGGSAADIDGDGKIDVVLTHTNALNSTPYVLMGNGDGTFTRDMTRMPAIVREKNSIYSLELVDLQGTGRYDLLIGANPPDATGAPISSAAIGNGLLRNDGTGRFTLSPFVPFPNPAGNNGFRFGLGLDFIVSNGFIYMLQVGHLYDAIAVQKIRIADFTSTLIYDHQGTYASCNLQTWFPWLYPSPSGLLMAQGPNVPNTIPATSCYAVTVAP
jgi:hypothetical protein